MKNIYYKINVLVEKEDDVYYAYCAELTGCHSQADSYKQAQQNIQEAVNLYLESCTEEEAIAYLSKDQVEATSSSFDIQLRLTVSQAEKLLLNAGFSLAGSKDNYRLYLKKNSRFILPLQAGRNLSKKMAKEILDLVES